MATKHYTVKETAIILGLTEQVVRNYINLGRITATKILNSTAISEEEIQRQTELRKEISVEEHKKTIQGL